MYKKGEGLSPFPCLLRGVDLVPRHGVNPIKERNQVVHPVNQFLHRVKLAGVLIGQVVGDVERGGVGGSVLHCDVLLFFYPGFLFPVTI